MCGEASRFNVQAKFFQFGNEQLIKLEGFGWRGSTRKAGPIALDAGVESELRDD